MNFGCQFRTTVRGSKAGAFASIWTRTTTAAKTATGAAVCIAMQSGQWSESLSRGCICATCTTASSASRNRHRRAAIGKAPGFARRLLRKSAWNPVKKHPCIKNTQN